MTWNPLVVRVMPEARSTGLIPYKHQLWCPLMIRIAYTFTKTWQWVSPLPSSIVSPIVTSKEYVECKWEGEAKRDANNHRWGREGKPSYTKQLVQRIAYLICSAYKDGPITNTAAVCRKASYVKSCLPDLPKPHWEANLFATEITNQLSRHFQQLPAALQSFLHTVLSSHKKDYSYHGNRSQDRLCTCLPERIRKGTQRRRTRKQNDTAALALDNLRLRHARRTFGTSRRTYNIWQPQYKFSKRLLSSRTRSHSS